MKLNKFVIATLLAMCLIGFSMSSVSANKLYFDGSKKLTGDVEITTTYNDNNGNQQTKMILDKSTRAGHRQFNTDIPNEAKYNDIVVRQHIAGAPHDATAILLNYKEGDVSVDFSLDGSLCKAKASHLKVTYEGKTVEANSGNNYLVYWAR